MILGNINQTGLEVDSLPYPIQSAIKWLKQTDFSTMENKKYFLDGNKMYVIISEYDTKPKDECKAEAHKNYLDIQFIIDGHETLGLGYESAFNELLQDYDEEKDRWLFKKVHEELDIKLLEGMFAVLFPTDIHRPGCSYNGTSSNVRKAVVKIAIDLL